MIVLWNWMLDILYIISIILLLHAYIFIEEMEDEK